VDAGTKVFAHTATCLHKPVISSPIDRSACHDWCISNRHLKSGVHGCFWPFLDPAWCSGLSPFCRGKQKRARGECPSGRGRHAVVVRRTALPDTPKQAGTASFRTKSPTLLPSEGHGRARNRSKRSFTWCM